MQHLSVVVHRSVVVSSQANPVSAHHSPLLPSNEGSGLPGKVEFISADSRSSYLSLAAQLENSELQTAPAAAAAALQPREC